MGAKLPSEGPRPATSPTKPAPPTAPSAFVARPARRESWSAPAERSGDGAFERMRTPLHPVTFRPCESGVASDLPPQSKSSRSFRCALHDFDFLRRQGIERRHQLSRFRSTNRFMAFVLASGITDHWPPHAVNIKADMRKVPSLSFCHRCGWFRKVLCRLLFQTVRLACQTPVVLHAPAARNLRSQKSAILPKDCRLNRLAYP